MSQNLYYICIARENTILLDYTEVIGNFRLIVQDVLSKIQANTIGIYTFGDYKFFIKSDNDNFIICILCSIQYEQREGLKALDQIMQIFIEKTNFQQRTESLSHSLDKVLKNDVKQVYEQFNSVENEEQNSINQVLEEIVQIEQKTLNELLQRDSIIELRVSRLPIYDKIDFKESYDIQYYQWWKNKDLLIAITIITILISWLISSSACGFDYQHCYD
ncbi:synaptobrevin family protein, putative (macronuclear) [Tetrahymena thermophila SB210]|uniref:Synaptobrevin family protein, putative n=1 Tax=Tetrahymena thermophila (strain SB210) TaxID=312017 RepID=I7MFS8_TETTS|nr:synaptobrevin family protein, putative [Tetrahymena thermophila SB210]EAR84266.1 synaptobrevin family protein, putative [Tetrahymena thermophila SB210]|eukprot:XP_001031929.1 synaptobrevin family protein, putative [Tetrahymena thermophila SB210]